MPVEFSLFYGDEGGVAGGGAPGAEAAGEGVGVTNLPAMARMSAAIPCRCCVRSRLCQ